MVSWENSASNASQFSEKYLDILFFANKKVRLIERDFPHLSEKTKGVFIKANMALLGVMSKYKLEKKYKKIEKKLIKEVIKTKRYLCHLSKWIKSGSL